MATQAETIKALQHQLAEAMRLLKETQEVVKRQATAIEVVNADLVMTQNALKAQKGITDDLAQAMSRIVKEQREQATLAEAHAKFATDTQLQIERIDGLIGGLQVDHATHAVVIATMRSWATKVQAERKAARATKVS